MKIKWLILISPHNIMKKNSWRIWYTVIALILVSYLASCFRKGEDDPWLSLRTRTNRLTHAFWILNNWKINDTSVFYYNFHYDSLPYQNDFVFTRSRLDPPGFCGNLQCYEYGIDSIYGPYTITKFWEGWDFRMTFDKDNNLAIHTSCYYTWDKDYDNPPDTCINCWSTNATGFDQTVTVSWDFSSGKTDLIIKQDGYNDEIYEIVGLRNSDLVLRRTVNGNVHTIFFIGPDNSYGFGG